MGSDSSCSDSACLTREALPGIWRIDVIHPAPGQTCCYLVTNGKEGAIIDTGAKNGVGNILKSVATAGLSPEQIKWIIVTHAHLDHAGAAGDLMQHFPQATLGGHFSTVKHLVNPDLKLLPMVRRLYGEKFFSEQYEGLVPSPANRSKPLTNGETIKVGDDIQLQILDTPGHAWHHISVYESQQKILFAGDAYGVAYPDVNAGNSPSAGVNCPGGIFIVPVMPPNQFNPDAARNTLHQLRNLAAKHIALSHFDVTPNTPQMAEAQVTALNEWEAEARNLARTITDKGDKITKTTFYPKFREWIDNWYHTHARDCDADALSRRHTSDIHLTVSGFTYLMQKEHGQAVSP